MRSHTVQVNFLSGVLDPRAGARIDTDAYNNGMLRGVNIVPVHLGGVRRRPGLLYRATMPRTLTRVSTSYTPTAGMSITAPKGGTTANVNDDSETTLLTTTSNISTTNPYVVVHYDLGAAINVAFADVVGLSLTAGTSAEFVIQYSSDDSSWTTAGSAFATVNTTARAYRRVGASARYWRVARVGSTDLGTGKVNLAEFNLWVEAAAVSAGRLVPFEVSATERYMVALTDRSMTVFSSGAVIDRQPSPYTSAQLADVDAATFAETMVLVHEDVAPQFLIRETTTNFQRFPITFTSVPQIDFADSSSPAATSDVQVITFASGWNAGDTFQIALDSAKTGLIVYAGDNDSTAAAIAREVQKMWSVQGFTGVTCARTGSLQFTVTLAGESADAYGIMSVSPISSGATASVTHSVTGVPRREDVWSSTRGWPRTVSFFEGRLYFGGTKSLQQTIIGSQVNNILEFNPGEGLDDDPIETTMNSGRLSAIQGLYSGRSFQLFTSGGEFRYAKETGAPITPGDAPVNQTQYGSAKIRPVNIDGATIYVQRNRKSIRDFRFDYTENAYNSLGVSSLAPHLIYDVQDLAAWNGSNSDEIALVFVVNGENPSTDSDAFDTGTVAVFNSRKEAQVQAWTIWTTQGEFKAVGVVLDEIYFLVQRQIDGIDTLFFEQTDESLCTDCATLVTNITDTTTVSGLDHLNGEECRVKMAGFVMNSETPSGGSITVEESTLDREVEVGLNFDTDVTPMPLQTIGPTGSNLLRKRRVVKIRAKVRNTLGLLVNGRPLPDRSFDIDSFDAEVETFTGVHKIEESTNYDEQDDKTVSFTQVDPLPMEILAIDVQLEGEV